MSMLPNTYYSRNYEKILEKDRLKRVQEKQVNPIKWILRNASGRAKRDGYEFNIDESDIFIPDVCPILGLKLFFSPEGKIENTPSIDRVDTNQGYLKGNVQIISWRANRLKSNLTLAEIGKLYEYTKDHILK